MHSIKSDKNNKYVAIEWVGDLVNSYKVFNNIEGKWNELVDLTKYSKTGLVDKSTKEKIDNYRIVDNSIYVISYECNPNTSIKEEMYKFAEGSYKVTETGKTLFEPVSGNICLQLS